ncbi:hypothetical protein ABK040_009488 [Willaertia magna]
MLTGPAPRTAKATNNNNQRTAPCGSISKKPVTNVYKKGEQVNVTWNIEANHGGTISVYLIDLPNGGNYTLASKIGSKAGDTTQTVTIPNILCNNCTLQWVWNSNEPTPYYGCVDIAIQEADNNNGGGNNNNNGAISNTPKTSNAIITSPLVTVFVYSILIGLCMLIIA